LHFSVANQLEVGDVEVEWRHLKCLVVSGVLFREAEQHSGGKERSLLLRSRAAFLEKAEQRSAM
jgi:hypothetical protein